MANEIVIAHPDMGVYLGNCMGLGWFSRLDAIGQLVACTFENEEQARAHIVGWDSNNDPAAYSYHPVAIAQEGCASIEEMLQAGMTPAMIGDEMMNLHLATATCHAA